MKILLYSGYMFLLTYALCFVKQFLLIKSIINIKWLKNKLNSRFIVCDGCYGNLSILSHFPSNRNLRARDIILYHPVVIVSAQIKAQARFRSYKKKFRLIHSKKKLLTHTCKIVPTKMYLSSWRRFCRALTSKN